MSIKVNAMAVLKGQTISDSPISFSQIGNVLTITGVIQKGLSQGKHGFHIHEYGDTSQGCTSAGAHFNPFHKTHGSLTSDVSHAGDLGNVIADETGKAIINITTTKVGLTGPYSVIGRALMLHADEDDLGLGNHDDSLTTGHAGARIACALIGIAK